MRVGLLSSMACAFVAGMGMFCLAMVVVNYSGAYDWTHINAAIQAGVVAVLWRASSLYRQST
jgi:tetrahydromethanopterin S-methyltransferase subunit C